MKEQQIKNALKILNQLGISYTYISRLIMRDHTTVTKWLKGERNISETIQNELVHAIKEIKEKIMDIDI